MYPVSSAFKKAIKQPVVEYKLTGTLGQHNFTEADILEGSFKISNQSTNDNQITLGSSYMGRLDATFTGDFFNRYDWYLKRIGPTLSVKLPDGTYEDVPLGVFIIKESKHTAEGVQVVAYDRMVKFGRKFMHNRYNYAAKPYVFLSQICTECDVTLANTRAEIEAMRNGERTMYIFGTLTASKDYENDIEKCWDAIFWLAQTLGGFATFNRDGELEIRQYNQHVVDVISEDHRLEGAVFDGYLTNFTGIYVENMDDSTESYYGYDPEEIEEQINTLMAEIAGYETDIDTLEGELATLYEEQEQIVFDLNALRIQYEEGQITEEEYLRQKAILDEQYDQKTAQIAAKQVQIEDKQEDIKLDQKYIIWLTQALEKAADGDEGTSMDLGANPFVQRIDPETESADPTLMRRAILKSLDKICYTPFTCSTVLGPHYDLGDVIRFTGGHADDDRCCIMAYEWTLNGEYYMQGWGTDTDSSLVKSKVGKAATRAQKTATKAENNATSGGGGGGAASFIVAANNNFEFVSYTEVS